MKKFDDVLQTSGLKFIGLVCPRRLNIYRNLGPGAPALYIINHVYKLGSKSGAQLSQYWQMS